MKSDTHYLSVREVADCFGITTRSVYAMLWDGRLQGAVRIGRNIRVPAEALETLPVYTPPAGAAEVLTDGNED
jgi:excisionase family DNA binding protein